MIPTKAHLSKSYGKVSTPLAWPGRAGDELVSGW